MDDKTSNSSGKAVSPEELKRRQQALGEALRACWTKAGFDVEKLAESTRISRGFLEALEQGNFAFLPGDIFARGFIRNICKAIGVDSQPFLADYEQATSTTLATPAAAVPHEPKGERSRTNEKHLAGLYSRTRQVFASPEVKEHHGTVRRKLALGAAGLTLACGALALILVQHSHKAQPAPVKLVLHATRSEKEPVKSAILPPAAKSAQPVSNLGRQLAAQPEIGKSPAATKPGQDNTTQTPDAQKPSGPSPANQTTPPPAKAPANVATVAAPSPAPAPVSNDAPGKQQTLELQVNAPVEVHLKIDGSAWQIQHLSPETRRLSFKDRADLLILDASAVTVSFNGKPLGPLGNKGRKRRLSFAAGMPDDNKL